MTENRTGQHDLSGRRKRAEDALRASEGRYQPFFSQAIDGIGVAILFPDGKLIDVNQWFAQMHGYSTKEMMGMSLEDLDTPDTSKKVPERIRRIMEGEVLCFEVEHYHKDGHIFPLEVSANLISVGGESCILCFHRDISERKRGEEILRESEGRYRKLFEHMQEGFAYCKMIFENGDPVDFTYLSVNAMFETLTGLKDVVGKRVSEVIPGIRTSDSGLFEIYGRVARTGNPERIEYFLEAIQHWFSLSVYCPEHGYFVAVFDDITARRLSEVEKEKMQAQLQQAMKMEAVGRLAGGVAHDFNNLLTVIMGYSELLLQKIGKESSMNGEVEEIMRAGERAASLTQQLLAFSRKQIIEPKVLHLDSLVAEMHKMLTRLIGEDIALHATPGKSLGSVKVDPGQFQQILMNLVVNARDAMSDGGKIVIETANVDLDEGYCALHPYVKPGRFVMLAVSDTGQGMSEDVKALIFEPFFTTKERGSGTGLGLSTAYGAVKQAGGIIEVYSEVGTGTTFKIYLPRVEEKSSQSVKEDRPQDMRGGSETVLLVEDEDIVRNLCFKILERLGYKVMQARNGAEAIALAQGYGDRIDLLLTDVVMPGMNGAELATQLILHHPEMKVLFTSGYTDDAIVHHGVLDEGMLYIGKPYTPLALAKKVRRALDKA